MIRWIHASNTAQLALLGKLVTLRHPDKKLKRTKLGCLKVKYVWWPILDGMSAYCSVNSANDVKSVWVLPLSTEELIRGQWSQVPPYIQVFCHMILNVPKSDIPKPIATRTIDWSTVEFTKIFFIQPILLRIFSGH